MKNSNIYKICASLLCVLGLIIVFIGFKNRWITVPHTHEEPIEYKEYSADIQPGEYVTVDVFSYDRAVEFGKESKVTVNYEGSNVIAGTNDIYIIAADKAGNEIILDYAYSYSKLITDQSSLDARELMNDLLFKEQWESGVKLYGYTEPCEIGNQILFKIWADPEGSVVNPSYIESMKDYLDGKTVVRLYLNDIPQTQTVHDPDTHVWNNSSTVWMIIGGLLIIAGVTLMIFKWRNKKTKQTGSDTEQFNYEIVGNREVEIIRYTGEDEKADIPNTIKGLPVTKIRTHAFAGTGVVEVNVPEGVETIETEAFAICDNLQRITLPASLKTLGQGVFKGSEELSQIEFSNENQHFIVDDGVLYHLDRLALVVCPPGLKKETLTVPMGIMVIASGAFYQNSSLKYVKLPISLERIETEAFLFTPLMKMIELPPRLKEIAPDSFLLTPGPLAEKKFEIYAFANTVGYKYAVDNHIPVHQLLWMLKD